MIRNKTNYITKCPMCGTGTPIYYIKIYGKCRKCKSKE